MARFIRHATVMLAASLVAAGSASANSSTHLSSCSATHKQAVAALHRAERGGPKAVRRLVRFGAACGATARKRGIARPASVSALDDTLLRQSASNPTLAAAVINSMTTGPGYPGETDDITPNVVDGGAGSSGTPQAAADVRARAAAATQCHGYLSNPNRIYFGSSHVATITKTVGGWCADGYTILSVTNWGHLVPWMNPSYPAFCWGKGVTYKVAHGPEGSWHYDKGAYHSTWAHGYIEDAIGSSSTYGCVVFPGNTNYWSIIRFSAQVNPFYWDGYNDFGLKKTV